MTYAVCSFQLSFRTAISLKCAFFYCKIDLGKFGPAEVSLPYNIAANFENTDYLSEHINTEI